MANQQPSNPGKGQPANAPASGRGNPNANQIPPNNDASLSNTNPSPYNQPKPNAQPDNDRPRHTVVADADTLRHSGKNVSQVDAPIVTVNETSGHASKTANPSHKAMGNVVDDLLGDTPEQEFAYDVKDTKAGSGLFVPLEPNQTIDQLMYKVEAEVHRLNEFYSIPAHNAEGEEILDQVAIKEFKRNDDKTIQLSGKDEPITGANQTHLLRRIQIRQYVTKSVMKGDKFDTDGALIVRIF